MSPIDAAMKELTIEMEALRNRVGNGPMPERLTVTVEFDRTSGMPRLVELEPQWRRRINGSDIATRTAILSNNRRPLTRSS